MYGINHCYCFRVNRLALIRAAHMLSNREFMHMKVVCEFYFESLDVWKLRLGVVWMLRSLTNRLFNIRFFVEKLRDVLS